MQKIVEVQKQIPDINLYNGEFNPTLLSPNSPFYISFAATEETTQDPDVYRNFLYSAITAFRTSIFYKKYKGYLINLGINCCQMHPNIKVLDPENDEAMATIELHHHVMTIMDMALIISNAVFRTYGSLTTFDLEELLRMAHKDNMVNVIFLCRSCHELYHNNPNQAFKIPATAGFGNMFGFLEKYKEGITKDFAYKLYYQLKTDLYNADERDEKIKELLKIRDNVIRWSDDNEKYFR